MKKQKTLWMVKVAMLAAAATVLMLLEFPLPFIAPPFYELDFSEIPVLLGGFALGPGAGVAVEGLKILLNLLINGTVTAGVGEAANFVMGVVFVVPATMVYKRNKSKKNALLGLVVGGATMVILGCLINAFIMLPVYGKAFGMPIEAIVGMAASIWHGIDTLPEFVLLCVAPFNLIKVTLVSLITVVLYKPMRPILKK